MPVDILPVTWPAASKHCRRNVNVRSTKEQNLQEVTTQEAQLLPRNSWPHLLIYSFKRKSAFHARLPCSHYAASFWVLRVKVGSWKLQMCC